MLSKSVCLLSIAAASRNSLRCSRSSGIRISSNNKSLFEYSAAAAACYLNIISNNNYFMQQQINVYSTTNDGNKPPQQQQQTPKISILKSPIKTTHLGDDLKKIIGEQSEANEAAAAAAKKKTLESEEQQKQQQQKQKQQEQDNQGRFARLFSKEHAWKVSLAFFLALFGGSFVYILVDWGAPQLDENKQPMMKNPSTEKLLPDPIQHPYYQPPYTLVIEMTGVLLHPEWTFSTGWRYKKRPGLDYFIDQIKYPMFEVVLFTREPFLAGSAIAASLDPQGQIQFKLFRESTKYIDNKHVKDLSFMNRDLSKIIVIDWDESSYSLQSRNALHRLKKWEGDETDTDLVYLASFLKTIAVSGVEDVREVLDYYNKEVNPLETFKENQVKVQIAELERQEEIEKLKAQKKGTFSLFRRNK